MQRSVSCCNCVHSICVVLYGCVLLLPWLQKTITNRLKDLEMFSAGLGQELIRRQEKLNRTIFVLQTGMLCTCM